MRNLYEKKQEISSIRNILSRIEYREYSVSGIQDYFECIIKIHETVADNPLKRIYVNITGNNRKQDHIQNQNRVLSGTFFA